MRMDKYQRELLRPEEVKYQRSTVNHVYAIEEHHVIVNVEIRGRSKPLTQCHRSGLGCTSGQSGLVDRNTDRSAIPDSLVADIFHRQLYPLAKDLHHLVNLFTCYCQRR